MVPWIVSCSMIAALTPSLSQAQGDTPASPTASMAKFLRYEPTGLSLLSP